jgi:hypothetical protein
MTWRSAAGASLSDPGELLRHRDGPGGGERRRGVDVDAAHEVVGHAEDHAVARHVHDGLTAEHRDAAHVLLERDVAEPDVVDVHPGEVEVEPVGDLRVGGEQVVRAVDRLVGVDGADGDRGPAEGALGSVGTS